MFYSLPGWDLAFRAAIPSVNQIGPGDAYSAEYVLEAAFDLSTYRYNVSFGGNSFAVNAGVSGYYELEGRVGGVYTPFERANVDATGGAVVIYTRQLPLVGIASGIFDRLRVHTHVDIGAGMLSGNFSPSYGFVLGPRKRVIIAV